VYAPENPLGILAALLQEPHPETPLEMPTEHLEFLVRLDRFEGLEAQAGEAISRFSFLAGVARNILRFFDSCSRLQGRIAPSDRYVTRLEVTGCKAPFVEQAADVAARMVPDDTIFLWQAGLPGDSIWSLLPPPLRSAALLAWKRVKVKDVELPPMDDLLSRFRPEFSLAFLGLDSKASLETFTSPKDPYEPLFGLHLQLMLKLRPETDIPEVFDEKLMAGLFKKFKPRGIGAGRIAATEYCRKKGKETCFAVIRHERSLFVVTGAGEGARVVQTLQGRRKSLHDSLFARVKPGPLTLTLKTRRLVRDLVNKGFPPYFLQILSSVLEIRLTVRPEEYGTSFDCEFVMR